MQERSIILPDSVQTDHAEIAKSYLRKARAYKVSNHQMAKVKGLRRLIASMRPKPVPDTGVIYERTNPNGSKRQYKVQPNGEWRRVKG